MVMRGQIKKNKEVFNRAVTYQPAQGRTPGPRFFHFGPRLAWIQQIKKIKKK